MIAFQPAHSGSFTGSLAVNSDRIALRGDSLSAELMFAYEIDGLPTQLTQTNPSIVFPPAAVSNSSEAVFIVRNIGIGEARITSLGVDQGSAAFAFQPAPDLPLKIAPGGERRFPLRFTPVSLGFVDGNLRVNNTTVPLVGSGIEPPPLPEFSFSGPAGVVPAASQSRIGITLTRPYPVPVSGTLSIEIGGDLPADPAVQFASGGRTVEFEIPANSTQAVFAGQADRIGIQTGTVASSMRVVPTFRTKAGGVQISPEAPRTLDFSVARAAPVLQAIQASSVTGNSFVLTLVGFTTTRELTAMTLRFTPVSGVSMPNPELRIDLRSASTVWFQRQASQSFGGQFTLTLPLAFSGTDLGNQQPVSRLASIAATAENSVGLSNAVEVAIP
jgi:hypothetical protein